MTEIFGLFDAADPGAPDRVYTSEAFARLFRTIMRDGVVHNDGDELVVSPTVPAAMSVDVGTGMALVQGRYYINSADLTLTVEAADPSYPRIDRVIVRADLVGRTVHAVVRKGTPAASPVPPTLTRTTETWELSLAQVRVEAGATSIIASKITDERGNASLCGVAAPLYVPSSQVEVVGAMNMQGHALTGLPAPNAATDAARRDMGGATLQNLGTPTNASDAATKTYVDGATAVKLSTLPIDADKDWQNRKIKNVGGITYTKQISVLGNDPLLGEGATLTVARDVAPSVVKIAVIADDSVSYSPGTRTFTVKKNGTVIATKDQSNVQTGPEGEYRYPTTPMTILESYSINPRDVYTVECSHSNRNPILLMYGTPPIVPPVYFV